MLPDAQDHVNSLLPIILFRIFTNWTLTLAHCEGMCVERKFARASVNILNKITLQTILQDETCTSYHIAQKQMIWISLVLWDCPADLHDTDLVPAALNNSPTDCLTDAMKDILKISSFPLIEPNDVGINAENCAHTQVSRT